MSALAIQFLQSAASYLASPMPNITSANKCIGEAISALDAPPSAPSPIPANAEKLVEDFENAINAESDAGYMHALTNPIYLLAQRNRVAARAAILSAFSRLSTREKELEAELEELETAGGDMQNERDELARQIAVLRAAASSSSGSERASILGVLHAYAERVNEGPERFVEEIASILRPFPAPTSQAPEPQAEVETPKAAEK